MTVTVLDVGKADCIVVEEPGGAMLIDTGTRESADAVLAFLQRENIVKLSLLVLTHMDKDHIGGAAAVLGAVEVERVIQADYDKGSDEEERYQAALSAEGIRPVRLREPLDVSLGAARIRLTPGEKATYKQSNDYSIFTAVQYGDHRFLFTGDGEKTRLKEFLGDAPSSYDFLKVPHHGRGEKNSGEFIRAVSPRWAVITCSAEEPPDDEVVSLLEEAGAAVFLTSRGPVTAVSDGKDLRVTQ